MTLAKSYESPSFLQGPLLSLGAACPQVAALLPWTLDFLGHSASLRNFLESFGPVQTAFTS